MTDQRAIAAMAGAVPPAIDAPGPGVPGARASPPVPAGAMREVKVSAHAMALEPGLYCLVHTACSAVAPSRTGLPAVRVVASPAAGAGTVAVASLPDDGWLRPDDGALLRVAGGLAEVMVTVYQDIETEADPPRLQVLRLSGDTAPQPGPATQATPAPADSGILAHVYGLGDVTGQFGAWIGEPGGTRWIEGFAVLAAGGIPVEDIDYQAVLGRGWLSPWSSGGQYCGSRGMSLPILGLCVRLRGPSAASHQIQVWARFVDGTELGPVDGGTVCEAASFAALEAFRLMLEPLAPAAAAPRAPRRR